MKKIKIFLIGIISLLLIPIKVNAASGNISVSGASTAIVGNRITINVTLSSSTAIGSWQMDLNYDKSFLQLVGSTAEGGGTRMVNSSASGTKSKTYTFTFKALKSGSTRLTVSSYLAYAYSDISEMSLSSGSKSVRIMTQSELEATYSKDNFLKSLLVEGYELDKTFNKETTEYSINVPTGTTSIKVTATPNDTRSNVSGTGEITVSEGLNTHAIVVTAQNGAEKTYTLTINVEDQNPINVKVENSSKNYVVVKNSSLLTAPPLFTENKTTIQNFEIPTFVNEATGITLVGLKDETGTIELFVYKNNKYTKYNELDLKKYMLIPTPFSKELDLIKTTITLNGEKVTAYKYSDSSDCVIINAKNLETGKEELYLYDTKNSTAIKYDDSYITEANETIKNYTYIIITFASALIIMLIVIFSLLHSLKKKQKKINKFVTRQEAKIEATRKLNDVVNEVKKITAAEKQTDNSKKENSEIANETIKLNKVIDSLNKEDTEKKEQKDIKKNKKKKETKKLEETNIEIKEVPKDPNSEIKKILDDEEEVYDLFEDEKKKKKKK